VLVPNPFYRVAKAPVFNSASSFNFQDQAEMAKLKPLNGVGKCSGRGGEGCSRLHCVPGRAITGQQGEKDRDPGLLHGRGAGGEDSRSSSRSHWAPAPPFTRAVWVTDKPDSPQPACARRSKRGCTSESHRTTTSASRMPKTSFREAFAAAKVPAEIEVYPAKHGWCVPDMPVDGGAPIYSMPEAEKGGVSWSRCTRRRLPSTGT